MQPKHKLAELKYKNIRSIAYEITMDELPYQDKKAIFLTDITHSALAFFLVPIKEVLIGIGISVSNHTEKGILIV